MSSKECWAIKDIPTEITTLSELINVMVAGEDILIAIQFGLKVWIRFWLISKVVI